MKIERKFIFGLLVLIMVGVVWATTSQTDTILINNGTFINLNLTFTELVNATANNNTYITFAEGLSKKITVDENTNFTENFTVSFWINKTGTTDAPVDFYLCKSDVTGNQRSFQFHSNSGNDVWFLTFPNGTNTNATTNQWNNAILADTWYHVIATHNGTANKLYGNGQLVDTDNVIADPNLGVRVFDGTSNLTWGNCQSNAGYYDGSIDEVMVFNKTLSLSEINDIYLNGHTNLIKSTEQTGYFDDFSSYSVGVDTMTPSWIPQYSGYVNITSNGKMMLDYLIENPNSDRDLYVELNRSEISDGIQNITIKFQFNVTACNQSFFVTEGIGNIGASGYLWYFDADNFLSFEMKTNASASGCGTGQSARITIYKRIGGTTTALNPQTLYTFNMSEVYNATILFKIFNSTNYNLSASIDEVVAVSSNNISTLEVKDGAFLLEVSGTKTLFDNVNLTRTYNFQSPTNFWRMNENQGTTIYEANSLANGSNSGGNYSTDAVRVILINGTDYTVNSTAFSLINNQYSWTQIIFNYFTDVTAPSITLNSPEYGTQDTDGVIRFTFTPTDANSISNCSLMYGSSNIYTTTNNVQNGTQNVIEVINVESGHPLHSNNLQWFVRCTDLYNNIGNSATNNLDTADFIYSTGSGTGISYTDTETQPSGENVTINETLIAEQLQDIKETSNERKIEIGMFVVIALFVIMFIVMIILSARN